jgi:RNA polymerase sigma-70 factor (ECF subfamily)
MQQLDKSQQFLADYESFSEAIFRHCFFRVSDREKARDLMQDTFVKAWQQVTAGADIKNMRAFLYRVANNLIIDEYRKKKTYSLDQMQEAGFELASQDHLKIEKIVEGREALEMLEQLDDKYKEVIIMRYIDDLSPQEIAEVVGESENLVSVRIHRGLVRLRELVNKV